MFLKAFFYYNYHFYYFIIVIIIIEVKGVSSGFNWSVYCMYMIFSGVVKGICVSYSTGSGRFIN